MQRNKKKSVRDYIVKNSKFVFPIIVIIVVAVTVSIALSASNAKAEPSEQEGGEPRVANVEPSESENDDESMPLQDEDVPLTVNEDEKIQELVVAYYNAKVLGDSNVLNEIYDEVPDREMLDYMEVSKYLEYIPALEIYTKPGLKEGDTIVYVYYRLCFVNHEEAEFPGWQTFYACSDENGELYFKSGENISQEEADYIWKVSGQDDVVVLNNRVTAEYNELLENRPEMSGYMDELRSQIDASVGVALAERNADGTGEPEGGEAGGQEPDAQEPPAGEEGGDNPQPPAETGPQYATATTTVNVRNSDSERADKLGKVTSGTRLQVQEVRLNGWTKVVYEGQDGYIKSEFLEMEESVAGLEAIGTVTATANINVRTAASQNSESLGILTEGASLQLYALEGEWCKVNYEGRIGYVKGEFVTQQ